MSVLNASVCVSLTQHRCQTYQWCPFHVRQTVERSDDVTVRRKIYCQACINGVYSIFKVAIGLYVKRIFNVSFNDIAYDSLMSPVLYFKCTNFSAIYVMSIHFVSLNSVFARNMVYLNSKMLSL